MLLRQRYSASLGGHSMIKIEVLPTIAGALLVLGLSAAPAKALANRTFVSGKGCFAWNTLIEMPWKIIPIGPRERAYRS
jgi:hypothetical protein